MEGFEDIDFIKGFEGSSPSIIYFDTSAYAQALLVRNLSVIFWKKSKVCWNHKNSFDYQNINFGAPRSEWLIVLDHFLEDAGASKNMKWSMIDCLYDS